MRISTSQVFQSALGQILQQQYQIARTQQQLSSGKRILAPSDDPAGSATLLGLQQSLGITRQYQQNIAMARTGLNQEESTLASVTDMLDRVRELAVQANNSVLSDSDRRSIATELRQDLDHLLGLANTRDSNGEYIFAGYQARVQPFSVDAAGEYVYSGDGGQRFLQVGPSRQVAVNDSGLDVFVAIRNGNGTFVAQDDPANAGTGVIGPGTVLQPGVYDGDTYTITFPVPAAAGLDAEEYAVTDGDGNVVASGPYVAGGGISFAGISVGIAGVPKTGDSFSVSPAVNQDVFTSVAGLISVLEEGGTSTAAYSNAAGRALGNIDQAMESIGTIRSQIGARLRSLDSQENLNEDSIVRLEDASSQIQDLDYASAITQLTQQMNSLDASQKSFLQIQGLSLFKYL
jgi:flagellar hook-associated protein 3 FlgL